MLHGYLCRLYNNNNNNDNKENIQNNKQKNIPKELYKNTCLIFSKLGESTLGLTETRSLPFSCK